MLSAHWVRRRQPHWTRLEALVARAGRAGVPALDRHELRELALLYRQTAADLAAARADPARHTLAESLNALLGRAHHLVYTGEPASRRRVWHFYSRRLPAAIRESWREIAAAAAIFIGGAVAGALTSAVDPGFPHVVLGGPMLDTIERREMWTHPILAMKPLATAGIMTNNLSVSFTTFGSGLLLGLGPLYLLFLNGLLLGVVGHTCFDAGMSTALWSFVAPHGALELPAIVLAGGAGLVLARGLVLPGALPRRQSLARAGARGAALMLGVIPMLVLAGVIEGFVSAAPMPPGQKFVIGAALLTLLILYVTSGRRQS
ncbi:MAG TPA: stage II sporulation protein M [Vicinamibacterales bacterium]